MRAVIVAVPPLTPVTFPVLSTLATLLSLVRHLVQVETALSGYVRDSCSVLPFVTEAVDWLILAMGVRPSLFEA